MTETIEGTTTEKTCFEILAHVGSAKSFYIEAIRQAEEGDLKAAEQLIAQGDEEFAAGHARHFDMLQKDVSGEKKAEFSLILLHTEDQMASAETLKTIADGFLKVYKAIRG